MCAVDGMVYYSEDKRIRWDGAIVCKKNLEPRQPQELIKSVKEDTRVPDTRDEKGRGSDQAEGYIFSSFYATGATEVVGAEGEWTQPGGIPPATLALINQSDRGVIRIVADPMTAWTGGSYVTLGNDDLVHWSGEIWLIGAAAALVPILDSNGDPVLDGDGNPIYTTI